LLLRRGHFQCLFIIFTNSRIILADGQGTVASLKYESLSLNISVERPVDLPAVSSPTHPDQAKFYMNRQVAVQWERELGYRYSYILTKRERVEPDNVPEEEINSTIFDGLEDGIYWFGIKAIDRQGRAGAAAFFRLMIDGTPPQDVEASITQDEAGRVFLALASTDKLSGIDYYEIKTPEEVFKEFESQVLTLDKATAITVKVFDKAGNVLEKEFVLNKKSEDYFLVGVVGAGILVFVIIFYFITGVVSKRQET